MLHSYSFFPSLDHAIIVEQKTPCQEFLRGSAKWHMSLCEFYSRSKRLNCTACGVIPKLASGCAQFLIELRPSYTTPSSHSSVFGFFTDKFVGSMPFRNWLINDDRITGRLISVSAALFLAASTEKLRYFIDSRKYTRNPTCTSLRASAEHDTFQDFCPVLHTLWPEK